MAAVGGDGETLDVLDGMDPAIGDRREVHAVNLGPGGAGQRIADLREAAEDIKLRPHHVHLPGEEQVNLGRASTCGGTDRLAPGNVLHRLLDGPGERGHHFVGWHYAVVHHDDNAWEVGLGEDRGTHLP